MTDIDIAAGDGKDIVAADRHEAVGELHDKSGRAEAENVSRMFRTFRDLIFMKEPQLQLGFFVRKNRTKAADRHWEITVAMAAPRTPSPRAKIKRGSSTRLVPAPIATDNMPMLE